MTANQPRQIKMVFPLKFFNDSPLLPPSVNTCIEAMRGWGRSHTTRNFQPSTTWKIEAGDLAIAIGGNGEKVAFRVGREYRISPEMAADPSYQAHWADQEKHSAKYLVQDLIRKNPQNLWGLEIEPLGDWQNGKIIAFPDRTSETQVTFARFPPAGKRYYEVSTKGDKRFSALNATLRDGRTIEEAYQLDVKGFRNHPQIQAALQHSSFGEIFQNKTLRSIFKGQPPLHKESHESLWQGYKALWQEWADDHPKVMQELGRRTVGAVLTDFYASSPVSQARALAEILNDRARLDLTCSRPTPEIISCIGPQEIIVFGSNTEGRHGAGLARQALEWGAEYGNSSGRQGSTYAIVTKDLRVPKSQQSRSIPLKQIEEQIETLCKYAKAHSEQHFLVTKIGCGLGGYSEAEIGKLWVGKDRPGNVRLPQEFLDIIAAQPTLGPNQKLDLDLRAANFERSSSSNQIHYTHNKHPQSFCFDRTSKTWAATTEKSTTPISREAIYQTISTLPPPMSQEQPILIACDGACSQHQNGQTPGGWGAIVQYPDGAEVELSGGDQKTTNNRMELRGLIEGFKVASSNEQFAHSPIVIITDSKYLINGAKNSGSRSADIELWQHYDQLNVDRIQDFEWVKGHSGHPLNERADRLAVVARDQAAATLNRPSSEPLADGNVTAPQTQSPVYLSLVAGKLQFHETWDECRQTVHQQSNAKYQKCRSPEETTAALLKWGIDPQTNQTLSTPSQDNALKTSEELIAAIRAAYQQIPTSSKQTPISVGEWTAWIKPDGDITVRSQERETLLRVTNDLIEIPLSNTSVQKLRAMKEMPKSPSRDRTVHALNRSSNIELD